MPNRSAMIKINKNDVYIPKDPYKITEGKFDKPQYLVVSCNGKCNVWMTEEEVDILTKQGYVYVNKDNMIQEGE